MKFLYCIFLLLLYAGCKKSINASNDGEINLSRGTKNFEITADQLLQENQYKSLVVEIQYMKGFQPDARAVENVKSFLYQHLHKPAGIYFYEKELEPLSDSTLSVKQIDSIRNASRRLFTQKSQLAVYILYANGESEDGHTLGQVFSNATIVIFGKRVKKYESVFSFPTQTTLETTILLHEMGHLLGLVNAGSAMQQQHADSAHTSHCNNRDCIMYWGNSTKPMYGPLKERKLPTFDSACLADLKANGGR